MPKVISKETDNIDGFFKKLLSLSELMLEKANDDKWKEFYNTLSKRESLIESNRELVESEINSVNRELLNEIKTLNQDLVELAKDHQKTIGNKIQTHQKGSNMQRVYKQYL